MSEYFGNSVLYKMCQENIKHTDKEIVSGKIWLISRSYSVSPQRRKTKPKNNSNSYEFFFDDIAKLFVKSSKSKYLDEEILRLSDKVYVGDFEEDKKLLLDTIKLVDTFNSLIREAVKEYDKCANDAELNHHISLASKYLHFHLRNIVFIFDSYSSRSATNQYPIHELNKRGFVFGKDDFNNINEKTKKIYAPHVLRCYAFFRDHFKNNPSPRYVDVCLLKGN